MKHFKKPSSNLKNLETNLDKTIEKSMDKMKDKLIKRIGAKNLDDFPEPISKELKAHQDKRNKEKTKEDRRKASVNISIASSQYEITQRYGSAGAEYSKGLRGIDYETGQSFSRSLEKIHSYKTNPKVSIHAKAGFAAENISISKHNAEAIIQGKNSRKISSEDVIDSNGNRVYGTNHETTDIIKTTESNVKKTIQMKLTKNPKKIIDNICNPENNESRYLAVDEIELVLDREEQIDEIKKYCREKANEFTKKSKASHINGDTNLAQENTQIAESYQLLEKKITNPNITIRESILATEHPKLYTLINITKVSHSAGVAGAKLGAVIGGSISLVIYGIALHSGDKELKEAILNTVEDTAKSAGMGYTTGFFGSLIKTFSSQSSHATVRAAAKTNLPATIISICASTGKLITRYAKGEINEAELAKEMGVSLSGMLSASMFAGIGQLAIPVPVLGGMIGGLVGYAMTNTFYQSFFDVLKEAKLSKQRREMVEMHCATAKMIANAYRENLTALFNTKIIQLKDTGQAMFDALDNPELSCEEFCTEMNRFALVLGKDLPIKSKAELDQAMQSDKPLQL